MPFSYIDGVHTHASIYRLDAELRIAYNCLMKNIKLLKALRAKYQAEMIAAEANLQIYLENSVGIGEHSDLVKECDTMVSIIADAKEKLGIVDALLEGKYDL